MNTSYTTLSSHTPSPQPSYVGSFADSTPAPSTDFIASAMDELACGVVIIDRHGHLLHSNLAAEAVLMRSDCVVLVDGKVTVTHKSDERQFSEALLNAAAGKRSMVALGVLSHTTVAVYDGAMAALEAMKKANSTDPAKFGPEIFNVSFTGATGKVEFDAKGDRKDAEITIFKMTGGKIAPVSIVKNGVATAFVPAAAPVAAPAMAPAPAATAPATAPVKPPEAPKK